MRDVHLHAFATCATAPKSVDVEWLSIGIDNGRHTFHSVQDFSRDARRFVKHTKRREISNHASAHFSKCERYANS